MSHVTKVVVCWCTHMDIMATWSLYGHYMTITTWSLHDHVVTK